MVSEGLETSYGHCSLGEFSWGEGKSDSSCLFSKIPELRGVAATA